MTRTLAAQFTDRSQAQSAVAHLEQSGFTARDVSFVAHESSGTTKGAAIGGVSGLLLGSAALAIPGVGPVVVAGPIAGALTGATVGVPTGGMLGALADMGVDDDRAQELAESVGSGGAVVLVRASDCNADEARSVLSQHGAVRTSQHNVTVQEAGESEVEPANFGDEGGSSQWGQRVLRPDGLAKRTISRDKGTQASDKG